MTGKLSEKPVRFASTFQDWALLVTVSKKDLIALFGSFPLSDGSYFNSPSRPVKTGKGYSENIMLIEARS